MSVQRCFWDDEFTKIMSLHAASAWACLVPHVLLDGICRLLLGHADPYNRQDVDAGGYAHF